MAGPAGAGKAGLGTVELPPKCCHCLTKIKQRPNDGDGAETELLAPYPCTEDRGLKALGSDSLP